VQKGGNDDDDDDGRKKERKRKMKMKTKLASIKNSLPEMQLLESSRKNLFQFQLQPKAVVEQKQQCIKIYFPQLEIFDFTFLTYPSHFITTKHSIHRARSCCAHIHVFLSFPTAVIE
jgi:hypothetical protein